MGMRNCGEELQIRVEEIPTGSRDSSGVVALVMVLKFWDTTLYILVIAHSHT